MNDKDATTKPEAPGSALSVDDALEGWGNPSDRANVLALEVEKLRARLEECRKFRGILIRRIAERDLPPNDEADARRVG